jgi:hypothetical protein
MSMTITAEMITMHEVHRSLVDLASISARERVLEEVKRFQVDAIAARAAKISKQMSDQLENMRRIVERAKQVEAYLDCLRAMRAACVMRSKTSDLRSEHRGHDGSTGKGKKSSAKKSSKAASGGDGGGDGDGPQRKRAKKQRHTIKNRNAVPSLSPSSSPGTVVKKSPAKSPSDHLSVGKNAVAILAVISLGYFDHAKSDLTQTLAMIFVFILGLSALDMRDLATRVWDSVPKLLPRLKPLPTDET